MAVTVYNLADGKGVIIGDSVAIPEPYVTDVDFKYADNVSVFSLFLMMSAFSTIAYRNLSFV